VKKKTNSSLVKQYSEFQEQKDSKGRTAETRNWAEG